MAQAINCNEDEIFFCSGATEANLYARKVWKMKSDTKVHDSLNTNSSNYDVWAMSLINNETGRAGRIDKSHPRVFLDLTAAVGHVNVDMRKMPEVIAASFSGHKFGSLQGVGVIYIRREEQEKLHKNMLPKSPWSLCGGTPNVIGIYSLGIAIKDACNKEQMAERNNKIEEMIFYITDYCIKLGLDVQYSTHIVNITFNHINGSLATNILAGKGIDISVGSACHSGGSEDTPSKILLEDGFTEDEALRTVRVSLSANNTMLEIIRFTRNLRRLVDKYDRV